MIDVASNSRLLLLGEPASANSPLRARLLVVTASGRARVHSTTPLKPGGTAGTGHRKREPAKAPAHPFTLRLAAELEGAILRDVRAAGHDRVVTLEFESPRGERRVVAELFGAEPNLLLLDSTGTILALLHPRSGKRKLTIGAAWTSPHAASLRDFESSPPMSDDPESDAEFAARVDAAYAVIDRGAEFAAVLSRLRSKLAAKRTREEKKRAAMRSDLESAAEAPRLRELADILAANFTLLRTGMDSLRALDLYRGGEVTIPLDPALSPKENVARHYHRVEKKERGAKQIGAQLALCDERLATLDRDLAIVEGAASLATSAVDDALRSRIEALAIEHEVLAATVARDLSSVKRRKDDAALEGLRRFHRSSGALILVGSSDADNDRLTHRIARANDVWMHVEGFPGSHVVLRLPRGATASLEDLLAGARLAVHFSKRRGAARAFVIYTEKKYVRKGKGKAGLALVDRHKTLTIDHDPKALAALLAGT